MVRGKGLPSQGYVKSGRPSCKSLRRQHARHHETNSIACRLCHLGGVRVRSPRSIPGQARAASLRVRYILVLVLLLGQVIFVRNYKYGFEPIKYLSSVILYVIYRYLLWVQVSFEVGLRPTGRPRYGTVATQGEGGSGLRLSLRTQEAHPAQARDDPASCH
eukprot:scaffold175128_cov21-Prasinocladus_malaysianus.AAC.2